MNPQKRYTHSFLVTLLLYTTIFAVLLWGYNNFIPETSAKEKSLSLSQVSLRFTTASFAEKKEEVLEEESKEEIKEIPKEQEAPQKKPLPKESLVKKEKKPTPKTEKTAPEKPKEDVSQAVKEPSKVTQELTQKALEKQETAQEAVSENYEEAFVDENLQKIVKLIQNSIIYPKRARDLNIQGEVLVSFTLSKEGTLENLEALQGHILLKKSALAAIEEAFTHFPKVEKTITLKVPIRYSLVNGK